MTICAEVIAIGDEITSGQRLDTNSAWLAQRLGELGIRTLHHSTVGDDLGACSDVFRTAIGRAEIVVTTGGLGPTQDDLTRRALADATDRSIEIRQEALQHIESIFSRRGREMPERNQVQAEFPQGSRIIPNPQGTAPGIDLEIPRDHRAASRVFCLPGVPAEMKQMWTETVQPLLGESLGASLARLHHVIKCFGIGESEMESRIPELLARDHVPQVGITVNRATISLRISAEGSDSGECQSQIDRVRAILIERVGDLIFGEGDSFELEHAVAALLDQRKESLCCIELGFNSLADTWMSALERPDLYRGGISLSDSDAAKRWFSVFGSGGEPSHEQFAESVRNRFGADWALLIDGYPSVVPVDDRPIPSRNIQLSAVGGLLEHPRTVMVNMGGHPDVLPARIAKSGLDLVRQVLMAP